jgi:hypothetical protein
MNLAIAVSTKGVSRKWLAGWTDLLMRLSALESAQVSFVFNYAPVVCMARVDAAAALLETGAELFLFLDDDNPPSGVAVAQLIADLAASTDRSIMAGWYWLRDEDSGETALSFGRALRVIGSKLMRRRPADERDFLDRDAPDIQEIDWTGLGMVLMRREVLQQLTAAAFLPEHEPDDSVTNPGAGWLWDDMAFCKRARAVGLRIFVDRRVKLEHLKLVDVANFLLAGEAAKEPPSAGTDHQNAIFGQGVGVPANLRLDPPPVAIETIDAAAAAAPSESAETAFVIPEPVICDKPGCQLQANHPGSCYPGAA